MHLICQKWTFIVSVEEIFKDKQSKTPLLVGHSVNVTSTCQDPLPYSMLKTDVLICGNFVQNQSAVLLDPCPPVNWTYFDNPCKLSWLKDNVWSNCDAYTSSFSTPQLVVGLVCGILVVTGLFATFCVWWFKERNED
eukprot:TRINITY_DN1673_c0_g1_i1.p1 TRINITY_DN1673_c0_g1~~TRINITY_DN1673_c0_g1_i1.p1  ORF type:complete len:137 (+),score=24.64 TRINITY_DN1673_c0_g1_i1:257-667(+)